MSCNFKMFQLAGRVTVDHTKPDDFLDATRSRYGTIAPSRLFQHGDQAGAVAGSMASAGEANIVGHGKAGIICTGSGRFMNANPLQRIAKGNIGGWAPSAMTKLTLLGCNTGEGVAGAKLLSAIAQATGAIVTAPIGYVYIGLGCDDFFLEPGTGWQTATPKVKPEPVLDALPAEFLSRHFSLMVNTAFTAIEIPIVTSVRLYEPGPIGVDAPPIKRWDGAQTSAALSRIELDAPFLRGAPAAIETGRLELLATVEQVETRRMFQIYNDNRLRDMTYPDVFYRANVTAMRA